MTIKELLSVLLLTTLAVSGCHSKQGSAYAKQVTVEIRNTAAIEEMLASLLDVPCDNAFVTIKVTDGDEFIQVGADKDTGMCFQLDTQGSSPAVLERAKKLFAEMKVDALKELDTYNLDGTPAGKLVVFQVEFERDTARAADFARTFFERVYQLAPETMVTISLEIGVSAADLEEAGIELPEGH